MTTKGLRDLRKPNETAFNHKLRSQNGPLVIKIILLLTVLVTVAIMECNGVTGVSRDRPWFFTVHNDLSLSLFGH